MSFTQHLDLNTLIQERRQEKWQRARDRIESDLKAIQDKRRCSDDIKPFPVGAFEHLRKHSVWDRVLEYINDPSDVSSACFSCRTFEEKLEEKRKLLLLSERTEIKSSYWTVLQTLGTLQKVKWNPQEYLRDFLGLRGVSKSCKSIADTELFDTDFLDESWYNNVEDMWHGYYYNDTCNLNNEYNNRAFRCAFALLPRETLMNSSFIRKVFIERPNTDQDNPEGIMALRLFFDNVLKFLDLYGHSVWHVVYEGCNELDDYDYLLQLLEKMPNLKALTLSCCMKCDAECLDEELEIVDRKLEEKPFPFIESLQYLNAIYSERVLAQIYRRCTNLKSVNYHSNYGYDLTEGEKVALRMLSLEGYVGTGQNFIVSNMPLNWPLKKLDLGLSKNESAKTSTLWPAINQFRDTLEVLKLHPKVEKDDATVELELYCLKTLDLESEITSGTIGFDDLIPLKSLEKMSLCYWESTRTDDENGIVEVFGFKKNLEKSNIWNIFSNLKELEFKKDDLRYKRRGSTLYRYALVEVGEFRWTKWVAESEFQI